MFDHVNWLAVIGAAIVAFAVGGIWYGPLFGKRWMELIGKRPEEIGNPTIPLVVSFFTALVAATALAVLVTPFANDLLTAAFVGLLVWVASGLVLKLNDLMYGGRPAGLFYLDSIHHLIAIVVMAIIVSTFRS